MMATYQGMLGIIAVKMGTLPVASMQFQQVGDDGGVDQVCWQEIRTKACTAQVQHLNWTQAVGVLVDGLVSTSSSFFAAYFMRV